MGSSVAGSHANVSTILSGETQNRPKNGNKYSATTHQSERKSTRKFSLPKVEMGVWYPFPLRRTTFHLPGLQTPKGGIDPQIDMKWGPYAPKRPFTEGAWSHQNLAYPRVCEKLRSLTLLLTTAPHQRLSKCLHWQTRLGDSFDSFDSASNYCTSSTPE